MNCKKMFLPVFLVVFFFQTTLFAQPPSRDYVLLFEDNFNGKTVDENAWSYRLDRRQGGSFSAMNRQENVFVSDGFLHIAVRQDTIGGQPENTGGGLISKHQFGYGYYETLSKPFMAGTGVHSAFWQAGGAYPGVENRIFEIDSYEIDSKTFLGDNNLYVHICPKEYKEVPWPHRAKVPMSYRPDGWLLDAFEYTPEGVLFYDNGKVIAKAEWNELTAAQKVWLTALNGFGKVEKEKQPGETLFDYFRYYAKDYPGINILPNGNFEYNQDRVDSLKPIAWLPSGTPGASKVVRGDASRDHYFLRQSSTGDPYSCSTSQSLEFIMNGKYRLTAKVRCSGGQKSAKLRVSGNGSTDISVDIVRQNLWTEISIPEIQVSNHKITVEISSEGSAGQWLEIDDINLYKPGKTTSKSVNNKPFELVGDPIWHLAKKQPIVFSGDQKFYFFDRNVGYGDAMSVSFNLTADIQADMVPIARFPEKGNSGWAIRLTSSGGAIFRIGSKATYFDVAVPKVYERGKACSIACVFDRGKAEVYKNGLLLKTETGIKTDTKDASMAGRLGDVGEQLQVIDNVFIPVKNESGTTPVQQNQLTRFKGSLGNIRVYNRALTSKEITELSGYKK